MLLLWEQLVLHYGQELQHHVGRVRAAGQTTYALLCCGLPGGEQLRSSGGDHAEAKLLETDLWRRVLPAAIEQQHPRSHELVTVMAVNRSPCANCTALLVAALEDLRRRFPVRLGRCRFVLAARGAYEDGDMIERTTQRDLERLHAAGWELCVLVAGTDVPSRARILQAGIERVAGHGFVRLG